MSNNLFSDLFIKKWKPVSLEEVSQLTDQSRLRFKVDGGEVEGCVMTGANEKMFYAFNEHGHVHSVAVSKLPITNSYEALPYESMYRKIVK